MNPTMTSPSAPNLVGCLMADRMAEASELRRAAEVSHLDGESHRLRRILTSLYPRGMRQAQPVPLAHGQ